MSEARTDHGTRDVPAADVDRHRARRGSVHAYVAVDPERTALVVVDLIPFFTEAASFDGAVVGRVDRLAGHVRRAGGVVAWVVPTASQPSDRDRAFFGDEVAERYATSGGTGPIASRLASGLHVADDDVLCEKSSPGAFFPGRSDLHHALSERRIETVVIAGTVANVCCESTVREAWTLGYQVVLVSDAIGAVDDESLHATLRTVYRSFGDVRTAADCVELLASST